MTRIALNLTGVADRLGISRDSVRKYKSFPPPDIEGIGVDEANYTDDMASTKLWFPETVDIWNANRPGAGARTDLRQKAS